MHTRVGVPGHVGCYIHGNNTAISCVIRICLQADANLYSPGNITAQNVKASGEQEQRLSSSVGPTNCTLLGKVSNTQAIDHSHGPLTPIVLM